MNIFEKLRRKKLSQEEQMRLQFRDAFDDCIKSKVVRSHLTGNSLTDGMLVYTAIANTYKSIKENRQFNAISALCLLQHGFNPSSILEDELHRALKKYCGIEPPKKDEDDLDFLDFPGSRPHSQSNSTTPKVNSSTPRKSPSQDDTEIEYSEDKTTIINVKKCPGHFVIPEGVTTIGENAFRGLNLYSIVLPRSLRRIEENAFCSCAGLKSVEGGDNIEYLGAWAFSWCLNLTGFSIPKTLKEIDSNPFAFTMSGHPVEITSKSSRYLVINDILIDGLEGVAISYNGMNSTVEIPDIVNRIGDSCFRGADYVHKLVIPRSVTSCENNPIPMCGIRVIESSSAQLVVRGFFLICGTTVHAYFGNEENVVIPDGVSSLADCSFDCISEMETVKLPSSITSVGDDPFRGCDSLETVLIPRGESARFKSLFPEDFDIQLQEY